MTMIGSEDWLHGGGEMVARIRAHRWEATPLGAIGDWPQSLRTAVGIVLGSGHAMQLAWGPERTILYNDASAPMLGERNPAALGLPFRDAWPDIWAEIEPLVLRVDAGETVRLEDMPLAMPRNGSPGQTWWDFSCSPIRDETGSVAGLLNVTVDVTAGMRARRAAAALRDANMRHRLLIESWTQAVWEADSTGFVVEDSPSWRAYTGQTLEEWLGYGWVDAVHPDDRAYAEQQWREAVSARELVNAEFRLRAPDGGWRWTNVRAAPVIDAEGNIEKWLGLNIDVHERKQAEAALRESEHKYRTLFGSMDEGFAVAELIYDADGRAVDALYLEGNPAASRLTGERSYDHALLSENIPDAEAYWLDTYDRVARTGNAERQECYLQPLGRWYDFHVSRVDGGEAPPRVAVVFQDITERREADAALRESEERQGFLLTLADALRPLNDPVAVQEVTARMLGETMQVDRCYYAEFDWPNDVLHIHHEYTRLAAVSAVGSHPISAFQDLLQYSHEGQPLVCDNIETHPIFKGEIAAYRERGTDGFILMPLVKQGGMVACMCVTMETPRSWTAAEVALVEDVAERTWSSVERARAEAARRESEQRFREFGENSADVLWIVDATTMRLEYLSPAFERIWGERRDTVTADLSRWADLVHPDDRAFAATAMPRLLAGHSVVVEYRIVRPDGEVRWIRDTGFPIKDGDAVKRGGGIAQDVTDLKRAEAAVRESEARLQVLIDGMPQLVWRAVDSGLWTWASPQWTDFTGQSDADSRGWGWLNPVHPDDRASARALWEGAVDRGEFHADYRLCHAGEHRYRWFQTRATPVRDEHGAIVEWLGTSTDVDDLRQLQQRQGLLVAELQHRTRNLITVVSAVSQQTIAEASSLGDFRDRFGDRLSALSRVQGLLSHLSAGERVTFRSLIESELEALGARVDRVTLDGPDDVPLRSATVQTFSLALHELATNALKYGALAAPGGHLAVRWHLAAADVTDAPRLHVEWRETGVGMTQVGDRPRGGGYGRELIEHALPYQLEAETTYELTDRGVHCTIDVPIAGSRP